MKNLLFVMLGGAMGSGLRYLVWHLMQQRPALAETPVATLTVNVIGCLAIGILGYAFTSGNTMFEGVREEFRLAIMVGVLGGFTTFSAFGFDTLKLWQDGKAMQALLYVLISNAAGLTAVVIGFYGTRKVLTS